VTLTRLSPCFDALRIKLQDDSHLNFDTISKVVAQEVSFSKTSHTAFYTNTASNCEHNRVRSKCWTCTPSSKPKTSKKKKQTTKTAKAGSPKTTTKPTALVLLSSTTKTTPIDQDWIIDSGATEHTVSDPSLLSTIIDNSKSTLTIASGEEIEIAAIGHINILYDNNPFILQNVMASGDINYNLLSVVKLTEKGFTVKFQKDRCLVLKDGKLIIEAPLVNGLFRVTLTH
jgi:hypothetical protein